MMKSTIFAAGIVSAMLVSSAAMAASASNLSSGGEAGTSGLGAETTPKMNGNDPAATGMTQMPPAASTDAMGSQGDAMSPAAQKRTMGTSANPNQQ